MYLCVGIGYIGFRISRSWKFTLLLQGNDAIDLSNGQLGSPRYVFSFYIITRSWMDMV